MMKRQFTISLLRWGMVVMLISMVGCNEKAPPASQPKSTSKKITVQSNPPKPAAIAMEDKASSQAQPAEVSKDATSPETTVAETSELIKESLQIAGSYDPEGRFNPFEPLFKEQPTVQETAPEKGAREKRKPQTPLERVALSQLKVTAIIRSPSGNRALVEDASGKGYVVKRGTYIGLNAGQVIDIDKDRIVVEEEIESVMGELRIENSELKLQKPAGEF